MHITPGVRKVIDVVVVVRCMCVYWVTKFSTCKCNAATEDALGNTGGGEVEEDLGRNCFHNEDDADPRQR